MAIQPILAALRKHLIPATLIVLEVALACAVLCNAVFMIGQRMRAMRVPNAIDQRGLVVIRVLGTNPKLADADIPRDLAMLRDIPGVAAVAAVDEVPLTLGSMNVPVATRPSTFITKGLPNATLYEFTRNGPRAMGLRLLRGRFFPPTAYAATRQLGPGFIPPSHAVILTQSLAARLWPDGSPIGKQLWIGTNHHFTVVGEVADVLRPDRNGQGANAFHWAMFFPSAPTPDLSHYVIRTSPADRARVLHAGLQRLDAAYPNAVVTGHTFTQIRDKYFATTRSIVWTLAQVCVVMLAVTAFSIVGLTSFWVGQRRRTIGIRRALGATRTEILRYFQTENLLLSTLGIVLGVILAFGANLYLMQHYQLGRMPWYYALASAVAMWILGQLAVLGPALRASYVAPASVIRSA